MTTYRETRYQRAAATWRQVALDAVAVAVIHGGSVALDLLDDRHDRDAALARVDELRAQMATLARRQPTGR